MTSGCGLLLIFLTGCSGFLPRNNGPSGAVFSWVRVPFSLDLKMTPASKSAFNEQTLVIREPLSGYGLSAEVKSNAIGDIAKKNGLTEVYFADMETLSILGVWTTETIYVYGKRK